MCDPYRSFEVMALEPTLDAQWVVVLGPPVLELSAEPTTDLFTEMDEIADKLRTNPLHVEADDQIKFRELQKVRHPNLSKQEWLDLFAVWRDRYRARLEARRADVGKLLQERDGLIAERAASPPNERVAHIDARLVEMARKLRDFSECGVIRF